LTENAKFGWRFFPRALARAPDPLRVSSVKAPGTCRIFVFGESAALGDPEPAYGFSRILRELLEARCPGTKFEVINTAMTAISSHVIRRIAQDCVPLHGDIWIVYMGNNEVVGPFGAGSVFGSKCPPLTFISLGQALKCTRIGQAADWLSQRVSERHEKFQQWEGMKMMLNDRIQADDPVLQQVYGHFDSNLRAVLSAAHDASVKPIVCTVSSNLRDCPPFASGPARELTAKRKAEWTRLIAEGSELESRGQFTNALANFRQAEAIDKDDALLSYHEARCFLAVGDAAAAMEKYAQARDLDELRFRTDTRINALIREVCASQAKEGVVFFDSTAVLTNSCKLGIPGGECFWDHVHFSFTGNFLLARGLADQVVSLLPSEPRRGAEGKANVLSEAECARRLAYTDRDRLEILDRMWRRIQEPPFTGQLDHQQLLDAWSKERQELQEQADHGGLAAAVQVYQAAMDRREDDWVMHNRFAFLLEAGGDLSGAKHHWQRVVALMPQAADAWFKLGDIASRQAQPSEATDCYRQVLRLRSTSFEAMNGLGLVALSQSQFDEAARWFEQALHINPRFAQVHVNWGLLCSRRGSTGEAQAHYRAALKSDPESAGAHINLANLLAAEQKNSEAVDHYRAALKVRPKEATVHLGLANALEALGRGPEAMEQYREAIRFNPALPEAHFNLGVALAKRGDLSAATACFQQATSLAPEDPQAHLDLGVAFAKQGQFAEAVAEFKTVLRLDPSNAAAQRYLQTALARLGLKR